MSKNNRNPKNRQAKDGRALGWQGSSALGGMGLGALISAVDDGSEKITELAVDRITANPYQPRKVFDQEALEELANSIKEHGVIQPIIVKEHIRGYYVIAGERRLRASKIAGLTHIPAIIKDMDDGQMQEIAIIENLQREDLNAMEIAEAYQKLIDDRSYTQDQIAKRVGKSRPQVANYLRLNQLPFTIKEKVSRGTISFGHARALLAIEDKDLQAELADKTETENLTVRQLENYSKKVKIEEIEDFIEENVSRETKVWESEDDLIQENEYEVSDYQDDSYQNAYISPSADQRPREDGKAAYVSAVDHARQRLTSLIKSPEIRQLEKELEESLGTKVEINDLQKKKTIEISYYSDSDLERIIEIIKGK